MKRTTLFSIGIVLLFCSFNVHKYYMSISHIEYVKKQKALQMVLRIFVDDLQLEINTINNSHIELATDREPKNADSIYNAYLKKHFEVAVNDSKINYSYIGKEYKEDIAIFYLEATNIASIENIKIDNSVLCRSFPYQENIIKLNIHEKHKTYILDRHESTVRTEYQH